MKMSGNREVVRVLTRWGDTLEELAEGEGTVVGFFSPIVRNSGKTPMPCVIGWSYAQMFEQTDDIEQCVKVNFKIFHYVKRIIKIIPSFIPAEY